jgi:hypothetical protein
LSSFCLSEDDLITKGKKDVRVPLINGNILVRTETATTAIANISMITVINEIMHRALKNMKECM